MWINNLIDIEHFLTSSAFPISKPPIYSGENNNKLKQVSWTLISLSSYKLVALIWKEKSYELVPRDPLTGFEDGLFSPDLTSNFILNSTGHF